MYFSFVCARENPREYESMCCVYTSAEKTYTYTCSTTTHASYLSREFLFISDRRPPCLASSDSGGFFFLFLYPNNAREISFVSLTRIFSAQPRRLLSTRFVRSANNSLFSNRTSLSAVIRASVHRKPRARPWTRTQYHYAMYIVRVFCGGGGELVNVRECNRTVAVADAIHHAREKPT